MKKYLLKSKLHGGSEIVVLIENYEKLIQDTLNIRKTMPFDFMRLKMENGVDDKFLVDDILAAEELLYTQREALDKIKEDKDKYDLGLINLDEFEKRKAQWAKFIK